jgi:hypothetical protein
MHRGVYINPSFDLIPILTFNNIVEWILIDHQPGFNLITTEKSKNQDSENFHLDLLIEKYNKFGFDSKIIQEGFIMFYNSNRKQSVEYYYSFSPSSKLDITLEKRLKNIDTLCLNYNFPNEEFFTLLPLKFNFIISTQTYIKLKELEKYKKLIKNFYLILEDFEGCNYKLYPVEIYNDLFILQKRINEFKALEEEQRKDFYIN